MEASEIEQVSSTKEELNAILKRLTQLENKDKSEETDAIMRESYSWRLNLLIHGVNESSVGNNSVWETRKVTKTLLDQCITDGLKLDPASLPFIDFRRLPRKPVIKNGKKMTRPIIVKLGSAFDKKRNTMLIVITMIPTTGLSTSQTICQKPFIYKKRNSCQLSRKQDVWVNRPNGLL